MAVWQTADAASLPFTAAAFNLVFSQFVVMFFADKVAAYREIRRVLQSGGSFLFNLWDGLEANPLPAITEAAAAEIRRRFGEPVEAPMQGFLVLAS